MSNYEDTLTLDELRKEVRRAWDMDLALNLALQDLPEVPSLEALRGLFHAAMGTHQPDVAAIGRQLQRRLGPSVVPYKTEYECAAGLWWVIRTGILASRNLQSIDTAATAPIADVGIPTE